MATGQEGLWGLPQVAREATTSWIGTQGQHGDTLPPPVLKIQPPVAGPGSPPPDQVQKAPSAGWPAGLGPQVSRPSSYH